MPKPSLPTDTDEYLNQPIPDVGDDNADAYLNQDIPDEVAIPAKPTAALASRADMGAFTGGMVGAQMGGPIIPARGVGAAIGAGVGHFAGQMADDLEQGGFQQATQNFGDKLIEAAKVGLTNGSAEMALPLLGQTAMAVPGVRSGLQKVGGAIAKKVGEWIMPPMNPETKAMAGKLSKEGSPGLPPLTRIDPTRDQPQGISQLGETIAYNAWHGTGGPLAKTFDVNEQAAQQAFERFHGAMNNMTPKDFEAVAQDVVTKRIKQYLTVPMDKIYDNIRQRAPGNLVNVDQMLLELRNPRSNMGNEVISGLRNIREAADNPKEIDQLIDLLGTPKKGTATQARPLLTLDQAMRLKTQLQSIADTPLGTDSSKNVYYKTAGRLAGEVEQAIQGGLQKASVRLNDPKLLSTYQNASQTYARLASKYDSDLLNKTLQSIDNRPGSLAGILLPQTGPGTEFAKNPGKWRESLDAFKTAYGPRWNTEVRPLMAATLANRAFTQSEGRYNGKLLTDELNKYGKENLDALLGSNTAQVLMDHAKTLERVAQRPKGPGSAYIKIAQASALAAGVGSVTGFAFTGDYENAVKDASATILIAPWVLGHLYGNPTLLKAFDSGLMKFHQTGKPPSTLMTTLRQAVATAVEPTLDRKGQALMEQTTRKFLPAESADRIFSRQPTQE